MGSFVDIIFLMILVAFIITRLYSVFGSNGNEEKVRIIVKPLDKNAEKKLMENISKVIKESNKNDNKADIVDFDSLSEPEKSLAKIPNFNKETFLRGACRVFEMVLQAFSSGNITGIKELVNKKIWEALDQVINFRKENNLS